jgi:hypothetical protein
MKHSARFTRLASCVKIGSLHPISEIVPVVQRIERGFPKAKTAFLLEFADDIRRAQIAPPKCVN